MMNQSDRIVLSGKIVEAPFEIANLQEGKESIEAERQKVLALDTAHKNLVEIKTSYIDHWQDEIAKIDGYPRAYLVEQDFQDAVNLVKGNSLFPNDPQNPPPSLAPNIWTKTKPYARNKAVGKFNTEAFGTQVDGELNDISSIISQIGALTGTYQEIELVTGQSCIDGTCSLPQYVTQPTCVGNGGIWTPAPDVIANNPDIQTAMTNLIAKVNALRAVMVAELPLIYTADPDATRAAAATANYNDISNVAIPAIDAWLALASFNTAHGETSCVGFYAHDPNSLGATKLHSSERNTLIAALNTRSSFATTRQGQLNGYLGSITQNLGDASVTGTGFYFDRWNLLLLRMDMIGGSLWKYVGLTRSSAFQDEFIAKIINDTNTYKTVLQASILSAPASGTNYVQLEDASGFAVGDNVYLFADGQEELLRTIGEIVGNRVKLGQTVPPKYRGVADFARMYKDLT